MPFLKFGIENPGKGIHHKIIELANYAELILFLSTARMSRSKSAMHNYCFCWPSKLLRLPLMAIFLLLFLTILALSADGLKCYTGFKILRGQTFGGGETDCKDDNEYCYNVTADAGVFVNAAKAGCSYYRCLLSRNKCINTEFSGVPVSFCCCNTEDLCNGQ